MHNNLSAAMKDKKHFKILHINQMQMGVQ
jgi:hypothetical protein